MLPLLLREPGVFWALMVADAYALELLALDIIHRPRQRPRKVVRSPSIQSNPVSAQLAQWHGVRQGFAQQHG